MVEQGLAAMRALTEELPEILPFLHAYVDALHASGQAARAVDYLVERTQEDPDNNRVRMLLARSQLLGGNKGEADATWSAVIARARDDEETYRAVGEMRRALGDLQGAEATYIAARKALDQADAFVIELERLHRESGRIDAAMQDCLTILRRADSIDPWVLEELYSLLKIAQEPGAGSSRAGATISAIEGLASQRPDALGLRHLLFRVLVMQKNGAQAVARAERWDRAEGDADRTSALVMLARVAADAADTTTALAAAHRALTAPIPRSEALAARTIVARAAEARGQLDVALEHYKALSSSVDGSTSPPDLKVAELSRRTGRIDEALAQYVALRARAGVGPRADDIRLAQADCYIALARTAEAIALYDSVAQTGSLPLARERAIYGAAEAVLAGGDAQDAAVRFRALADLYPDGALVNDALGRILLIGEGSGEPQVLARYVRADRHALEGASAAAAAEFAAIVQENSQSALAPFARMRCAQIAEAEGRADDALAFYESIAASWPNARVAPDALRGQADLYAGPLRQPEKALDLYGQFLEKYPVNVHVAEVRQKAGRLRRTEVK
jgi:tetratricopeptide (TPR) repeat protein